MSEIKGCPCCRGEAELRSSQQCSYTYGYDGKKSYWIKCVLCPLKTGRMRNKEKLIIGWNTRAQEATT